MAQHRDENPDESTLPIAPGSGAAEVERRIGRFKVLRLLGSGGQGEVYEALDERLNRRVALKLLSRRLDFLDPEISRTVRARFAREAEVAARLEHPGICSVYDFGEDEGLPWIAMRLVEGESLQSLVAKSRKLGESDATVSAVVFTTLAQGSSKDAGGSGQSRTLSEGEDAAAPASEPLREGPPSAAAGAGIPAMLVVAESAARALHAAHEAGLVHRDVKPGNLMVTPEGRAVVLDFGLAADEEATGPSLTATGDFLGTPAYMAPEQIAAGRGRVDRRTDVYALGVTLFECLSLRRPFAAPSREGLYRDILTREAPDLRTLNPAVSRDLATVVARALEKHPDRRYQTAFELAEDLRRVAEHEPIAARPVGPAARLVRWSQRNPAIAALLATVLIGLSVGVVWTALKNRELEDLISTLASTNRALERSTREALRNERRAAAEATAKSKALSDYERMADTRRLANARAEAAALWPVHPDRVPQLLSWQERYEPLFARLEDHERALEALRARAPAYSEAERARDFAAEFARIAELERRAEAVADPEGERTEGGRLPVAGTTTEPSEELASLRRRVGERGSWDFGEDVDLQFRHDTLAKLVADLRAAADEETGVVASIARRLDLSRRIAKETLEDHARAWREAAERIEVSPIYDGLKLAPQIGLVPLGPDPDSGLEEFLHWQTQDPAEVPPRRGADGRIAMTEGRGLIFVLIPGGLFSMGAQQERPGRPNFDPEATPDEAPVHEVALSPYLISKYEMTQGQWTRLEGENPSQWGPGWFSPGCLPSPVTLRHPVESVSWEDCVERLGRAGLLLPTEAQWERAARADGDTVYADTSELAELRRFANIAGAEAAEFFTTSAADHRDDFVVHAPVGSFEPNGFGLHDATGNLWEWCRDAFGPYTSPPAPGDGLREGASRFRVNRGGSFGVVGTLARLASRGSDVPTIRYDSLGVRPSRRLDAD